jgi:hypothetical protein
MLSRWSRLLGVLVPRCPGAGGIGHRPGDLPVVQLGGELRGERGSSRAIQAALRDTVPQVGPGVPQDVVRGACISAAATG